MSVATNGFPTFAWEVGPTFGNLRVHEEFRSSVIPAKPEAKCYQIYREDSGGRIRVKSMFGELLRPSNTEIYS